MCPVCSRVYHARCMETWLRRRRTCPTCRSRVRLPTHAWRKQSLELCGEAEPLLCSQESRQSQTLGETDSDTDEDSE